MGSSEPSVVLDIPIIAMTAHARWALYPSLAAGPAPFLKPVSAIDLFAAIQRVMRSIPQVSEEHVSATEMETGQGLKASRAASS